MSTTSFKEELLHYVWKMKRFDLLDLHSICGQPIQIISFGYHNHNAGPDFLNAKIKIGERLWHGNVEIHIKASDWYLHKHHKDPAYQNVILHVVYQFDKATKGHLGTDIPCLEIDSRLDHQLIENYNALKANLSWIPCANQLEEYSSPSFNLFLESLMVERLEQKSKSIIALYEQLDGDWEQTAYRLLFKYFGFKKNASGFERLSDGLSLQLLKKHGDRLDQIEALLFGQAGLIHGNDPYIEALRNEFKFLKSKYQLKPMRIQEWKFLRMRPANFPTIRIAQLAGLIHRKSDVFQYLFEIKSVEAFKALWDFKCSDYWDEHYSFNKASKFQEKRVGVSSIQILMINVVVPLIFSYGMLTRRDEKKELAIALLTQIGSEKNQIINKFKSLGIQSKTAMDSQALIQLKTSYCAPMRCTNCQIGNKILSRTIS